MTRKTQGYTIVELIIAMIIFTIVSAAIYGLLVVYLQSSSFAQLRAAGLSVAEDQIERLRSMSYNSLAVQGGSITATAYIPAQQDVKRGSWAFTLKTDIQYVDDAYDGCFNYGVSPCRNGPPKVGLPKDTNPRDYKVAEVTVVNKNNGKVVATLSSYFVARIAEALSNTSSMILVKVIDSTGNGVDGATVRIVNPSVTPAVDQTTTTDDNGTALFMDATPDSSARYVITASKSGYSTLSTIAASGSLIPTYPNVNAIAQNVSSATLQINQISPTSLSIQTVDINGNPVPNVPIDIKGGIKLYTDTSNGSYSYTQSVTTDGSGLLMLSSLVPGDYFVCYSGTGKCGGSSYYLATVNTAVGPDVYQPFTIPAGNSTTSGFSAMQTIKLVVTTNASVARIAKVDPVQASSSAANASTTVLTITGSNLSGATVKLVQGATSITGTVVGTDTAGSIQRQFNIQGVTQGVYDVQVTTAAGTVSATGIAPGTVGGFNVIP